MSIKVKRAWEQLGDKFQIANEVIKFLNNGTSEDLETLEIRDEDFIKDLRDLGNQG
jgi:hypothetical protein